MAAFDLVVWILPFVGFALVALYAAYVAYDTQQRKLEAPPQDLGPDPVLELERVNTELARAATAARMTLDQAREAIARGTR